MGGASTVWPVPIHIKYSHNVSKTINICFISSFLFLQDKYPHMLRNTRGVGTFCAIDTWDNKTCQEVVINARNKGRYQFGVLNPVHRFLFDEIYLIQFNFI